MTDAQEPTNPNDPDPATTQTDIGAEPTSQSEPTESDSGTSAAAPTPALSVRDLNSLINGELQLHTAHRDIALRLDGDVALRVLAAYSDNGARRYWTDRLDPGDKIALDRMLAIDMDRVIAMSWTPDHIPAGHHSDQPTPPERTPTT